MQTWLKKKTTKRRKFVIVSVLLSLGLVVVQRLPIESRYSAIGFFALASYLLTAWSLLTELRGIGWVVNLILPTLYPVSVALFYFLLPQASLTRLIVMIIFAISMYGLLLTTNIFAVASTRTIQLLRAARAVGFLLTILTSAFLYHVVFSLHVNSGVVGILVFAITFPLILQGVWSYATTQSYRSELVYALIGATILSELSIVLSFWLIDVPMASVVLSMGTYVLLGLFQHDLEGRLFLRTLQEYLGFAFIVFAVVTATVVMRWMR